MNDIRIPGGAKLPTGKIRVPSKKSVKAVVFDLFLVVVGCFITAMSTVGILLPNGLTSGGITGMVRMLQAAYPVNFSVTYYIFAVAVFLLCLVTLGKREARKILLLTILYPAVLMLVEYLDFRLLEEKDIILAVIYCGVFWGIGNGIIFARGYSFGGTDTLAKILQKKLFPQFSQSQLLMFIDAAIIIASAFIFGRNIALYALVTTVITSKVTDFVMFGFASKTVRMEIITDEYEDVSEYIMNTIVRGVSYVTVTGGYTNTERIKIITICSPRESVLIKQYVARVDKKAFVSTMNVENVWGNGEGFGNIEKD